MEDSVTQGWRFQAPAWSQPSSTDSSGGDNDHSVASLKFLLTIFTPTCLSFFSSQVLSLKHCCNFLPNILVVCLPCKNCELFYLAYFCFSSVSLPSYHFSYISFISSLFPKSCHMTTDSVYFGKNPLSKFWKESQHSWVTVFSTFFFGKKLASKGIWDLQIYATSHH